MNHDPQMKPAQPALHEGRWAAMAVMLAAGFMNLIDITIVNVALPSLQRNLGASDTEIEWVVAAYILAFSIGLLPFGRLGDMLGRREVFLAGVVCFTAASALCGLAPSTDLLVAARVLQGFAGAMMTPQTLAIAQVIFPPHERGSAFSLFGLTAGFAAVAGPLIGGLLIGANLFDLSWRPIFLVNVPVGILAVVAGFRFIPAMPGRRDVGIDVIGILIAAVTVLLVIFPLVEGRNFGWPAWCFILLALAPVTAFLFVRWQERQDRTGRPQLMPSSLLHNRHFMGGALVTTMFFSSIPGFFMVLAVFLQVGFGLDALHSGLTTVPFSAGVLLASLLAGRLGSRFTRQRILVGAALLVICMVWLRALVPGIGDELRSLSFLPPLLLGGLGLGTSVAPLFQTVLSRVEGKDAGSASGSLQAFQQAGGAFGVAVMGQLFFSQLVGLSVGSPHPVYVEALRSAMLYGVIVFTLVGIGGLLMRPPVHAPRPVDPVPAAE